MISAIKEFISTIENKHAHDYYFFLSRATFKLK